MPADGTRAMTEPALPLTPATTSPQAAGHRIGELLAPRSVAVIGASEDQGKFGGRLYKMLLKHAYSGTVYPINPTRDTLFGIKTFASVSDTPEPPDMVVMAVPQAKVMEQVAASAARGAKCAIIITAKFSDAGPEGAALEREIVAVARAAGMRLIGPNCLGVISPANQLVLCSSPALEVDRLLVSPIGFISQSGALMATIFDRAYDQGVGFTHCVSVGNQADLELCDFVEYLIDDPRTRVICSYIEGLKDPARFVALARRARAAGKPWLACKAGRTEAGVRAAFSHTASIAGSHAVLASVCRDEGVALLEEPGAMIALAAAMARHPGARVQGVAIATTSGGGGALAADALASRGMELATFTPATRTRLDEMYTAGQAANPVDFGGRKFDDAADVSRATAQALSEDSATDAVLFAITTAPMLPRLAGELATGMADAAGRERKPTFYVMQPGKAADGARKVLIERGLSFVNSTGEAIDALVAWRALGRSVPPAHGARPADLAAPGPLAPGVFDEQAGKVLLARYGVPVNTAVLARDATEAVVAADALGYPVVMKIVSPEIVHKSDAGGVEVGVADARAVAERFDRIVRSVREHDPAAHIEGVSVQTMVHGPVELIVGARRDPQFGPIVVVGAGGVLVELLPDRVISRAPLTASHLDHLLRELALWPLLAGYRGRRVDRRAALDAIIRIGWLAHDLRDHDFELDVNPLILSEHGCCAVDARLLIR